VPYFLKNTKIAVDNLEKNEFYIKFRIIIGSKSKFTHPMVLFLENTPEDFILP
jgi:hypothetical protein